jgi:MFS family permease
MSATRYGLTMAVTTLASVVGSFAGQTIVLRYGLRSVAAGGMALTAIGFVLLTTVSAGTFISNFFIGMLIFGAGLGAAFVAAQIAVTLGVATEPESMAASGLTDSSFSIGGAIGLAVASVVFALPDNTIKVVSQLPHLNGSPGLHLALAIAAGYAVLGAVAALLLLDRPTHRGRDRTP